MILYPPKRFSGNIRGLLSGIIISILCLSSNILSASNDLPVGEESGSPGCAVTTCEEYITIEGTVRHCETTLIANGECNDFSRISIEPFEEIVGFLSEVKNSEDFPDTIHENEKVLKALQLFLQMPDIQDLSERKTAQLFDYLRAKAKWEDDMSLGVAVRRLKDSLYLVSIGYAASTQPSSLYIFYESSYKRIATGKNGMISVIDFRLSADEVGVVFFRESSSHPPRHYALLTEKNGEWLVTWTPEGQKEWIPADEEITFLKNDLSLIQVKGSDFGLYAIEQTVRDRILKDIDRQEIGGHFTGIWERKGDAYVRRTKLPPEAPLYYRLREMANQEGTGPYQ